MGACGDTRKARAGVYPCSIARVMTALYIACIAAAVAVEFDRHRISAYTTPIAKISSHGRPIALVCDHAKSREVRAIGRAMRSFARPFTEHAVT